ncbi:hypothetical protein BASA50_002773 [Batrachochytrium salamandrivorans]|uniref:DH domain-containing protein n=1 Tax=Batrachochytrium salamandrivorans TaxID=1357716 RepID=A0ABQ8FLI5_9FUNG|nr:hypothetical protein BASA50_002773 [Batrachochytrium salamandrivorans]
MTALGIDAQNTSLPLLNIAASDNAITTDCSVSIDLTVPRTLLPDVYPLRSSLNISEENPQSTEFLSVQNTAILPNDTTARLSASFSGTHFNATDSTPNNTAMISTPDPFSNLSAYMTDLADRAHSMEASLTSMAILGIEGTSKLQHVTKGMVDPSCRTQERMDISTKAQFIRLERQLVEIHHCCQLLSSHFQELDITRVNISNRLASQSVVEQLEQGRYTAKIIRAHQPSDPNGGNSNRGSVVGAGRPAYTTSSSMDNQGSGASLDLTAFLKGSCASNASAGGLSGLANTHQSLAPTPSKMFSKLPKEVTDANLPKPELLRLSALYELIETEADYCRDLTTMISFHKVQLRDSKLISDQDINALFSNIDQLLSANQGLLAKLQARRDQNPIIQEIGDVISESADSLKVYAIYAANYPAAMKLAHQFQSRPEIKELIQKWMSSPEVRGLSLESFLIKPVQRICKYPLLLRELEKHTERAGNTVDNANLRLAAEKIEAVVMLVNEATRHAEERQRILLLETHIESPIPLGFAEKKHLKDGQLQRLTGGKSKDRYVLLFTDVLLICKSQKTPGKYELESGYSLAELLPRQDTRDFLKQKGGTIVQFNIITSDEKDILVFASSHEEDRQKWIDAFTLAFKDITEEHRSAVRSTMNSGLLKQASFTEGVSLSFRGSTKKTKSTIGRTIAIGTGSSMLRKQAAARVSLMENWMSQPGAASPLLNEPEVVEINGAIYKRTLAATGHIYYYSIQSHQSILKLPENYNIVENYSMAPANGGDSQSPDIDANGQVFQIEEEEGMVLELVEGFAQWRRVDRGDGLPYYFNINTQETRWEHPKILVQDS